MKKIFTIAVLLGILSALAPAFAQKVIEKTLPYNPSQKLDLQLKFGQHIQVNAWDKNEVYIKAVIEINSGRLNDALLMDFDSKPEAITVTVDFDKELMKKGSPADCPDADGSHVHMNNGSTYICSTITYQVNVPRNAHLNLETISANVELKDLAGPVSVKSISGFVDMNWPASKGADVAMKSITGELYSDLDLTFLNKKEQFPIVGYLLKGTFNGGGPQIKLESISNDIFLRKRN